MIKIILPAYNEERALPDLFNSFIDVMKEKGFEDLKIFLINDGSNDKTQDVARDFLNKLPLSIIEHKENKGLGCTVKTGFEFVLKESSNEDIIVVLDADNTHSPTVINNIANKIKEGYDIIIASRYLRGSKEVGVNFLRMFLSKMANLLLKAFFPITGVNDYTCGFRAYKSSIIKRGFDRYSKDFIKERGFTCMAEILIKLDAIGAKITEIPFILRYDLKTDKSKIKILETIAAYCSLISRKRSIILKAK